MGIFSKLVGDLASGKDPLEAMKKAAKDVLDAAQNAQPAQTHAEAPRPAQSACDADPEMPDIPATNMAPPSVCTPILAPLLPCTWTLPKSAGFWELLTTILPSAPFLNRITASAVSSTSSPGWLSVSHIP